MRELTGRNDDGAVAVNFEARMVPRGTAREYLLLSRTERKVFDSKCNELLDDRVDRCGSVNYGATRMEVAT